MKLLPGMIVLLGGLLTSSLSMAQMGMRPPAFMGGVPGMAQMQSISMQRHQARTLLYREALEELKKNPAAADVKECPKGDPVQGEVCIRTSQSTEAVSVPVAVKPPVASALLPAGKVAPPPVVTRKIALLFGNNAYPDPIPALETPIFDVQGIGRILHERFGYEVRLVQDAKKGDVVAALNRIGVEAKSGDSVLVVYAGHGYLMDDTKMGYWIPVDGSTKSPANWVSNSDISKFLKNIPARQVILISDSCFSGSLTREEKIVSATKGVNRDRILDKRSVLAMSSGGEEPVSDEGKEGHSIFAWALIKALNSTESMTPGVQLFNGVKNDVTKDYEQVPQYGAVLSAGHMDGGEYLFEAPAN